MEPPPGVYPRVNLPRLGTGDTGSGQPSICIVQTPGVCVWEPVSFPPVSSRFVPKGDFGFFSLIFFNPGRSSSEGSA